MLTGPARGGFLPWTNLWPRHRYSSFRQSLSRDRAPGGNAGPEDGPHQHALPPDHDRGEDGLPRQRKHLGPHHDHQREGIGRRLVWIVLACCAVVAICTGDRELSPAEQFQRASAMFEHGQLAASQTIATQLADRYQASDPEWSAAFRVLEAQSAAWRGFSQEVLRILAPELPPSAGADVRILRLSLLAGADVYLHRYNEAQKNLTK